MNKSKVGIIHLELNDGDSVDPCPFCGSRNIELSNTWTATYWIECLDCGAEITGDPGKDNDSMEDHEGSKRSAIKKWNTRAYRGV